MIRFNVTRESATMTVSSERSVQMKVEKAVAVGVAGNTYDGPYAVTPTADGKTLKTKDKYMKDDVTVLAIPVYDVSNTAGGTTFYIATLNEIIGDEGAGE